MTPTQAQSLTAHLAERVLGWTTETVSGDKCWVDARGRRRFVYDTAMVIEAWRKQGGGMSIEISPSSIDVVAWRSADDVGEARGESQTEAVSEAIGRASGWEGK